MASSENSKKGQYKRLLDGKTITAPPMGYKIEQIAPRTKYSYGTEVRVCPETSVIVQDIFETYAQGGHALRELSAYIHDKYSIVKPTSSLEKILSNKFYIGIMTYMDQEFPHIYPRFISEELFNKVQLVKSINNKYFKAKEVFDKKELCEPKECTNKTKRNHLTFIDKILLFCEKPHSIDEMMHEFKVASNTLRDTLFDLELDNKIREIQPRIWQTI